MKQLAIFGIFSKKLADQEIKIIDTLNLEDRKTKKLAELLKKFILPKESVLMIPAKENKIIYLAGRNLPKVGVISPESLNVYDLLKYRKILLDQSAIESIVKHYQA